MAENEVISIACASAFWGDTPFALRQLLTAPKLDVVALDYLSEVTMALMARAMRKDPQGGYAADFVTDVIEPHLAECVRRGIKLVTNAGGLNSKALRARVQAVADRLGVQVKIVCVDGDDLRAKPEAQGYTSANAYLGAPGIAAALAAGAHIVLTGRVVDSALVLGPAVQALGWRWDQYDLLAQGSLAGHIIECGTQCTGGNFTDWADVPQPENVGFPIVHLHRDGRFFVSKPLGTGGLVSPATVSEQILYEIGDPRAYVLPDVVCDFADVRLSAASANEVLVEGARGTAPTSTYKVSATAQKGWRISATAFIGGGDALAKARHTGEAIFKRCARLLQENGMAAFGETRLEALGGGEEALLRLSAAHERPEALDILAKEVAPGGTSLAPGMTSLLGGRASAMPRMAFSSFLIPKADIEVALDDGQSRQPVAIRVDGVTAPTHAPRLVATPVGGESVPLHRIARARSGDKGNHVNIGVIARRPEFYPLLQRALTSGAVAEFFAAEFDGPTHEVDSWELPGLQALNFLIKDCLGGGGAYSLRVDPQGKAFAQRLLQMPVRLPPGWEKR